MPSSLPRLAIAGLAAAAAVLPVVETLHGPVEARVVSVIDGDTLVARARIWLGQELETRVRIAGIDTPEMRGDCPGERSAAERARRLLEQRIGGGGVTLHDITYDKYGGRILARVRTAAGEDLGESLRRAGLARTYDGGRKASWCD